MTPLFIELTSADGTSIHINANRIDIIELGKSGIVSMYVGGSDEPFEVKELPSEIIARIKAELP